MINLDKNQSSQGNQGGGPDNDNGRHKPKEPAKRNGLWMLSAVGVYLLTAGKTILVALKSVKFLGAILSMLLSVWVYTIAYPLGVSIGLVLMLFIHEMGHIIAAKQKGLPVSAPMFIPFLGAFILMKRNPRDAATEAYVAIGGPLLGTLGAALCYFIGLATDHPLFIVIAYLGFFINLINLLPVHPLDGGRIAVAVTRWLWPVGLVGGLYIVYLLKSPIFFIIWAMFAWDLYQKYVRGKINNRRYSLTTKLSMSFDSLQSQGIMIPGEAHRRELNYTTFSNLDGVQTVAFTWEGLGIRSSVHLPQQGIIHKVHVSEIVHEPMLPSNELIIKVQVDYSLFENSRYYEVPTGTRIGFGAAYGGLALFLIYMLYQIHQFDLPGGS